MIDLVGGRGGRWHAVSGCDIVPVDSLLDRKEHSGCNTLHHVVTLLCYVIPRWDVCTMKPQVNSPIICKSPELPAAESCVIISKEFVWFATFKKHCLQLHSRVSTASVDGHDLVYIQFIHVNSADQWLGSILHLYVVNHRWHTLVSQLAMFLFNRTNTTSTVNSYSSTSFFRVFSHLLISISVAALVCTCVFPVRVSDTQWCMHTEFVFTCSTFHCHWRAKLMPFNIVSSSARLIYLASFSGHSQQASSSTVLCLSNATPIAKELASTHTFSFCPSTHQSPWAWLSRRTESTVSDIICCSMLTLVSSSQPFVTELALLLSTPQATWSQPNTGKCLTSLPHKENTARCVTISGASETMLPRFHCNLPCYITTTNPNTRVPSSNRFGSLHSSKSS